ncbi:hypothetical protein [Nocardioides soli]|uniref:Uncharacterized protein n=1 Tax=Nocardioides soli TaxID=1036020 RepID=A0A7W4Z1C5_9ACTN|nr:hypothetical protein [Nocardioides soli]MBB3041375.1 hypothetical protein [Nocardioides soli]
MWYLAAPNNQWATYPSSSASKAQAAAVRAAINATYPNPAVNSQNAKAKQVALNKVAGSNNVIICVWQSEVEDPKVPATKPDLLQCNSNRVFGGIKIPADGEGAKTYYRRGNGEDLAKGSAVEFGGPNASITIVQRTANGYTFNNGDTRREWTFDAPGDCRPRCPTAGSYSNYLIRPGAVIPDARNTNAERGSYCYNRPPVASAENVVEYRNLTNSTSTNGTNTTTSTTSNIVGLGVFPYAWTTSVTNGSVHPGPTQVEAQSAQGMTPYGDLFAQTVPNGTVPTQAQLNAAGTATGSAAHPTVDLNDKNRRAMAEGGVMNVTERTTYVVLERRDVTIATTTQGTVTVTTVTQPQRRQHFCNRQTSYTFSLTAAGAVSMNTSVTEDCQPWSAWSNNGPATTSTTTTNNGAPVTTYTTSSQPLMSAQTPQVTGFWQALTNHCNKDAYGTASAGYQALNASIDPTAKHSGSAVTPKMNNANNPVWGYGALNPKGTTEVGFFDKQCAFEGRLAQAGDESAERVFFRDNELRDVRVGLYRPASVGVVQDDGTNAIATVLTRWAEGTPQVNGLSNRGSLRSFDNDGDQVFSTSTGNAPVFKNWMNPTSAQARTWSVLMGQEAHFLMAGNWASDSGKPNVWTTKWIFAPNVSNRIAATRVGFGEAGGARSFDPANIATKIQGQVMGMSNGATTSPALKLSPR